MKKILLVIRREYTTRLCKTSFWVLTLLIPLLLAACYALPVYLASRPAKSSVVLVVDETSLFQGSFSNRKNISYRDAGSMDYARRQLDNEACGAILHIPARETTIPTDAFLYSRAGALEPAVRSDIDAQLQRILVNNILLDVHNISQEDYHAITHTNIALHTRDIETGRDNHRQLKTVMALILGLVIFMAIFLWGSQVMNGVMEEKGNRIVEVLASSLRPFQLMAGKVTGIALVSLTQLILWIILTGAAIGAIRSANSDLFELATRQEQMQSLATKGPEAVAQMKALQETASLPEAVKGLAKINFGTIVPLFVLCFLLGYLLYANIFAAVGSVLDREGNYSQFILPLTFPLLLPLLLFPLIQASPGGPLAVWLSMIPFTSPVAMMLRLPFGVPTWQAVLSMAILAVSVPVAARLAATVYRKGMLRGSAKF